MYFDTKKKRKRKIEAVFKLNRINYLKKSALATDLIYIHDRFSSFDLRRLLVIYYFINVTYRLLFMLN